MLLLLPRWVVIDYVEALQTYKWALAVCSVNFSGCVSLQNVLDSLFGQNLLM